MDSHELLDYLAQIGRPRVDRMDDGTWHASVELPAPTGVKAQVKSDFNHETHTQALLCVMERLQNMRDMVSNVPTIPHQGRKE